MEQHILAALEDKALSVTFYTEENLEQIIGGSLDVKCLLIMSDKLPHLITVTDPFITSNHLFIAYCYMVQHNIEKLTILGGGYIISEDGEVRIGGHSDSFGTLSSEIHQLCFNIPVILKNGVEHTMEKYSKEQIKEKIDKLLKH